MHLDEKKWSAVGCNAIEMNLIKNPLALDHIVGPEC